MCNINNMCVAHPNTPLLFFINDSFNPVFLHLLFTCYYVQYWYFLVDMIHTGTIVTCLFRCSLQKVILVDSCCQTDPVIILPMPSEGTSPPPAAKPISNPITPIFRSNTTKHRRKKTPRKLNKRVNHCKITSYKLLSALLQPTQVMTQPPYSFYYACMHTLLLTLHYVLQCSTVCIGHCSWAYLKL